MQIPTLREDQAQIALDLMQKHRIVCVMMGRRWGKTTLGGALACAYLLAGHRVAWIAPSFPQARTMWRWLLTAFSGERAASINRADRAIGVGRGEIIVYSAEAETSIRGNAFDLVIVDEAARIAEEVWDAAIIPTLADRQGRALLISTPKGKNWFWREWMRGKHGDPLYSAWQAPSSANPLPAIQEAYRQARERLPARIFAQEWDAQPVDEAGGVFIGARACAKTLQQSGETIIACDIGRDEDYTAVAAFDVNQQAILFVRRWRGMPYTETTRRIAQIAKDVDAREVAVESNAMGAAVADYLAALDIPVVSVATTRASKQRIVENLAAAIQRGEIALPNDDYVLTELENYTAVRRADGGYEYGAPAGLHDDCVMAIAWAYDRGRRLTGSAVVEVW